MCESLSNTVSKIEGDRLIGYIVCETCGKHDQICEQDYHPDPKLEIPTPPAE